MLIHTHGAQLVETKTTSYVIYRPGEGFRSNKSDISRTSPKLANALVWARRGWAERRCYGIDRVLPVTVEIQGDDVLMAELQGRGEFE